MTENALGTTTIDFAAWKSQYHRHYHSGCAHSSVKYCACCGVVYCEACGQEWRSWFGNLFGPYYSPEYTWTCQVNSNAAQPQPKGCSTCTHTPQSY